MTQEEFEKIPFLDMKDALIEEENILNRKKSLFQEIVQVKLQKIEREAYSIIDSRSNFKKFSFEEIRRKNWMESNLPVEFRPQGEGDTLRVHFRGYFYSNSRDPVYYIFFYGDTGFTLDDLSNTYVSERQILDGSASDLVAKFINDAFDKFEKEKKICPCCKQPKNT